MFGCAAVQSSEKEEVSQAFAYMQKYHYAPEDYRVFPSRQGAIDLERTSCIGGNDSSIFQKFSPLLKGYLRLGGVICGEPACDRQFGTTDFFTLVETEKIAEKYRNHYCKLAGAL